MLKILSADKEVISANIHFTADAIILLNNYITNGKDILLEEWEWYQELRSGVMCYIITNLKQQDSSL
ncbi:hypothetical protein [Niabella digestorum]|jgi:hypothetical protein|uniref:Uncharacterized protein n=1 Tax=Niabella digestorum TaxID=3117701 RepID=A0ABU7RGT8_9BACT